MGKHVPRRRREKVPWIYCDACGICIGKTKDGEYYEETVPFEVGEYEICGDCHRKVLIRGEIEIRRSGKTGTFLKIDGSIYKREVSNLAGGGIIRRKKVKSGANRAGIFTAGGNVTKL